MITGLGQEIRFALRGFAKSPVFTLIAVGSIALGIGANAAIFSLLDQLLLRPLPVEAPERLVLLDLTGGRIGASYTDHAFSNVMYRQMAKQAESFEVLMASYFDSANLGVKGQSETVPVSLVSGNFFEGLGLRPHAGRLIGSRDEETKNGHPVVVLSYGYWQRRFGGDLSMVGQTVRLNGQPYSVVGIAPKGFTGLEVNAVPSIYVSLAQKSQITTTWDGMEDPNYYFLHVYGRLKSGVAAQTAKANLDALAAPMIEEELKRLAGIPERAAQRVRARRFVVTPAGTPLVGERETMERALYLLMGMVGLVLVIACANVANLLMARAATRVKEVALRLALGATQGHLTRLMLVESLLLAFAGGALGLIFSIWIFDGILYFQRGSAGLEQFLNSRPDWRVAAFCFVASLLTGLLFGVAPTLRSGSLMILDSLKQNAGSIVAAGQRGWLRRGLVVAQVTVSLVLLVGAGLFAKSLKNLRDSSLGFRADSLVTFRVNASLLGYGDGRTVAFLDKMQAELAALPGVSGVSVAANALLENEVANATLAVEGIRPEEGKNTNSRINVVGPGYFRTLGIPLLQGREFHEGDQANSRRVAVVNEVLAKELFGGDAIGKRVGYGFKQGLDIEIIGVVKDGKFATMRETEPARFLYTPYAQAKGLEGMNFYVRSGREPQALTAEAREVLRKLDENLAMYRAKTMEVAKNESLQLDRTLASLSSAFGVLATLLAAIGLYGVMAFSVSKRTREIGIRLALGAERRSVIGMVMREVGVMLLIGVAAGLPLAVVLGRLVESQLWGMKGWDPLVLSAASGLLALVACLAGLLPAWRASRVTPMTALRYE